MRFHTIIVYGKCVLIISYKILTVRVVLFAINEIFTCKKNNLYYFPAYEIGKIEKLQSFYIIFF